MSENQIDESKRPLLSDIETQDETNKKREAFVNSLPEELKKKYEEVHRAASILDGLKCPFYLAVRVEEHSPIEYNRMSYIEPQGGKESFVEWGTVTAQFHSILTKMYTKFFKRESVVFTNGEGQIYKYVQDGQTYSVNEGDLKIYRKPLDENEEKDKPTADVKNS